MKSQAFFASLCLILVMGSLILVTRSAAGSTTAQSIVSLQGTIAYPQQPYSYIIYQQGSTYYAKNGTSDQVINSWTSTNFASVLTSAINTNGSILLKNGVYYMNDIYSGDSIVSSNIVQGTKIVGESMDNCIIDFSKLQDPWLNGGYIPNGAWADIEIRGSGITIQDLTFRSCGNQVLGLGSYDTVPSLNNTIKNLRFVNCSAAGLGFYDGSYSTIDNIQGDNPWNVVSFWLGQESYISLSNICMVPTLATASYVDDTVSFNPAIGANVTNLNIENIVGNYSVYKAQGGSNFNICGVVDFAGSSVITWNSVFGNQTWNNLAVSNIYAYYGPAIEFSYGFTGLTNSVFTNIHSSYAQVGGTENGIAVLPDSSTHNVTITNVVFNDIYIDHAYGGGFNFLVGGSSASMYTTVSHIVLQNLFLTDNNQAGVLYWTYYGTGGLNIGNQGNGINQFSDLTINNIFSTDDQNTPTDYYPVVFWTFGAAGSYFNITQIIGGAFTGNVNNQPYVTPGSYNLTISS